jgi:hypothetical protein
MGRKSDFRRSPQKEDRNTQQRSGDEARPQESREQLTRGGGHRSGSRGAGTLEQTDETRQPRGGPKGT